MIGHRKYRRVTVDAVHPGITVRYHYREGSSLATVVEKTDRRVRSTGPDCNGAFNHDQIDGLIEENRLQIFSTTPSTPDSTGAPDKEYFRRALRILGP